MAGSSSQQDSVGVGSSSNELTVRKILKTSRDPSLWVNFDLCEMSNDSVLARCKNCGKFLKAASNSTLRAHVSSHCLAVKKNPASDQSQISRGLGVWNFDAEVVRQRMAEFVIQQALPFSHFDNPRLTKLIQETLQPRYNNVSRRTLRRDCLKMWAKAKKEMINGFENLNTGVNLTTDVWSTPWSLSDSYICVTAHWVDPQTWQMMKRTITFDVFPFPHTGENIFQVLDDVIQTYKLQNKIFFISFDNASINTTAVQMLKIKYSPICNGDFYHSRCVAHIINLVVQDGLNVPEIKELKENFKTMIKDIFHFSKRRHAEYRKFCKSLGKKCYSANLDMPVRWSSTWKMFDSALLQRETLQPFHESLELAGLAEEFENLGWESIRMLTDLLEVFKDATTILSGAYYPTSCLVLKQLFLMCQKLEDFEFEGEVYNKMVVPMKEKFRKYFTEMPPVFTCAAALNPCINVSGVKLLIRNICSNLNLDDEYPQFTQNAITYFTNSLDNLFEIYLQKYGNVSTVHETMRASGSGSKSKKSKYDAELNLYNELRNENNKLTRGDSSNSELGRYKASDFLSTMLPDVYHNFDILAWWKERESHFPVLAAMARDLLSSQASTVASESAFSLSGRVLSIRRTRLTPEVMEMCICLKDYLDGAERIQHTSNLEGELEVEEELHEYEVSTGRAQPLSDDELAYDESVRSTSPPNV